MFGGPFYSQGVLRIINGDRYHYRHVSFARWVNLSRNNNYIEVTKNRRKFKTFRDETELEAFFDSLPEDSQ